MRLKNKEKQSILRFLFKLSIELSKFLLITALVMTLNFPITTIIWYQTPRINKHNFIILINPLINVQLTNI